MDRTLYEDIKYGTNIVPEEEYRETLITIADVASEMVEKTLGPFGQTTMINDGTFTYPTKDGWNVLKAFKLNDALFNMLYTLLIQVSFDLVSKVGDGTTTAFCEAAIFIHKVMDYLKSHDFRQAEFLATLNKVVDELEVAISNSKYVRKVDMNGDYSDIRKIAYVASNGNESLSQMIQEIYQETNNPNIYVTFDPSEKLSYDIQVGYKLDCNPIQQKLYRNSDDGSYIESSPSLAFIFDHNVNFQEHDKIISAISRYASTMAQPVVIFAPHYDDIMLNVLGTSMKSLAQQGQIPNILLVQVPLSMDIHREYLSDITLLTNAQVVDYGKVRAFNAMVFNASHPEEEKIEDALLNSDQYKFESPQDLIELCAGKIRKIIVGQKYVLLQEYDRVVNKNLYDATMKEVEETYLTLKDKAAKSSTPLHKEYMQAYQHYTKLHGNIGVLKIGGMSDLEKQCLKDSVDDAVLACRSAFDNGYIRGLNLAAINVIDTLDNGDEMHDDICHMLREVLFEMSMKVLRNKNNDGYKAKVELPENIDGVLLETNGCEAEFTNKEILETAIKNEWGFDLIHSKFMTDDNCYIINSARTDIEVIKGMVGILSTMLTSNQCLTLNRSYDRVMGQKQRKETMIQQKVDEWSAIAESVADVLMNKFHPSISQSKNGCAKVEIEIK